MLLAAGYLITVAGICRVYYTWKVVYSVYDTYDMYPTYLAGSVESHIAVVSVQMKVKLTNELDHCLYPCE
jgi:hypothetical protein